MLVVAGGVAANRRLKAALEAIARKQIFRLVVPPPELCTDNAAMIAWAGADAAFARPGRRSCRPRPARAGRSTPTRRPRSAPGSRPEALGIVRDVVQRE